MRIGFCDDDLAFLELLTAYCTECLPYASHDQQASIESFSSGEELLEAYRRNKSFDILFLDLRMKHLNGFETARRIRMVDNRVIIIFVTSLTHCILKSFEYKPFWYLIKPVTKAHFRNVLMKAVGEHASVDSGEFAFSTKGEGLVRLYIGCITYLESHSRQIRLHTVDGDYSFYSAISKEEEKLSRFDFIRIHKSYLVNAQYIKRISRDCLILKNDERLPVSERRHKNVLDLYTEYLARSSLS